MCLQTVVLSVVTVTYVASQQFFQVNCDFGKSYYPTNSTVKINGSLTSQFNDARSCHVKHNIESAIVRVTLGAYNSSSKLRALYSMVLENLNVLFVGVAQWYDLYGRNKYHFHACPQGRYVKPAAAKTTELDLLFFGAPENESFTVQVELDDSVLTPGRPEAVLVRHDGLAQVKAFDVQEEELNRLLQITASSFDTDMECLLVVSRSCSAAQSQDLSGKHSGEENQTIQLTLTKSGRITLSQYSMPKISSGRWYIGIRSYLIDKESSLYKSVNLTVTFAYKYDTIGKALPAGYMCIIAIFGGIAVAVFAHFFLNADFDKVQPPFFLKKDKQEGIQEVTDYLPPPIEKKRIPFKRWVEVIVIAWFSKGIKTYPYLTGVLAISFMVGSAQFVIARWSSMIKSGNRDLCYYNELCYRPISLTDMPSNFLVSNVPYVIHGIFLALSFSFREAIALDARCRSYSLQGSGCKSLPPYINYSLAYGLAWALVFEGLFSATYHLCPSRLTFQFDSAFMFIISGLVVIALFNCRVRAEALIGICEKKRHPSKTAVHAPKYFLFFVAPLLVLNYIGSVRDTEGLPAFFEVAYWIILIVWLIVMYVWAVCKVGVPCSMRLCGKSRKKASSVEAIVKWVWVVMFPLCLILIGINQMGDWSQFFLFSCVAAVSLSILGLLCFDAAVSLNRYRTSGGKVSDGLIQLCSPKRIGLSLGRNWHRVLYMVTTFVFWVFAMYFFKVKSTTRKVAAPSFSRTLNHDCILWDFFDYHDIWHMLSSFALFMSAYLLIYVTRKVEIYYWAEALYWESKSNPGQSEEVKKTEEDMPGTNTDSDDIDQLTTVKVDTAKQGRKRNRFQYRFASYV